VDQSNELTAELLVEAYGRGLFPMADHRHGPIHWYAPHVRGVLPMASFHVPRRLRRRIRQAPFRLTVNRAFAEVMRACAEPREPGGGTWINDQIIATYTALHRAGLAHSIEAWPSQREAESVVQRPVGGIYGVALGGAFFGESMFSRETDASKICLVHLAQHLRHRGFVLFDVQFVNPHLAQFGAIGVPRETYLAELVRALAMEVTFGEAM